MKLERDFLARLAAETGFRGEMLEKVAHLLNLLRAIRENDYLRTRLALKGGTALNLFHFALSRLSVDIDLNYVGAADRAAMLVERPELEEKLSALCEREGYGIRHRPVAPLLRRGEIGGSPPEVRAYTESLLSQCQERLESILPFRPQEREFLKALSEKKEIRSELLTDDRELAKRIQQQPMLLWRKMNKNKLDIN